MEDSMSQGVASEQQIIAEIERLELEARNIRRRVEHAATEPDRRALNRQLNETQVEIENLRKRLR
jgi:uncharacterized protein (UPF0335 family)